VLHDRFEGEDSLTTSTLTGRTDVSSRFSCVLVVLEPLDPIAVRAEDLKLLRVLLHVLVELRATTSVSKTTTVPHSVTKQVVNLKDPDVIDSAAPTSKL